MVLIIRNNRIQSRRHSKIKKILSIFTPKNQIQKSVFEKDKDPAFTMSNLTKVLGTFFLYTIAMFTLPFIAYFGVRHIMITEFHTDRFFTNCVSVLAAVIVVNIIIGVYAYRALHETDSHDEPPKPDEDSDSLDTDNKKEN